MNGMCAMDYANVVFGVVLNVLKIVLDVFIFENFFIHFKLSYNDYKGNVRKVVI